MLTQRHRLLNLKNSLSYHRPILIAYGFKPSFNPTDIGAYRLHADDLV